MKLRIELFIIIIILLTLAQGYDLNDSFEYSARHSTFSLNSTNSSNLSLYYRTYNLEKVEMELPGKHPWFVEGSGFHFINQSANINYSDLHSAWQANVAPNMKNRSNRSFSPFINSTFGN